MVHPRQRERGFMITGSARDLMEETVDYSTLYEEVIALWKRFASTMREFRTLTSRRHQKLRGVIPEQFILSAKPKGSSGASDRFARKAYHEQWKAAALADAR